MQYKFKVALGRCTDQLEILQRLCDEIRSDLPEKCWIWDLHGPRLEYEVPEGFGFEGFRDVFELGKVSAGCSMAGFGGS